MQVLFLADIHIKLGQSKVPDMFHKRRVLLELVDAVGDITRDNPVDLIMIGGDILDVPTPSYDEVALMLKFLRSLRTVTGVDIHVFHGNHEALSTKKGCLFPFSGLLDGVEFIGSIRSKDYDVIDYFELHNKTWKPAESKLCFTHVRGEIPPHVKPEIDLERFSKHGYTKVIAGDLHSRKNSQGIIEYPGSPFTTSFHKTELKGANGAILIDTDTLETNWIELDLPQLIRVEVKPGESTTPPDDYHHYTYRVIGTMEEISNTTEDLVGMGAEVVVKREEVDIEEYSGETLGEEVRDYANKRLGITSDDVLSNIPSYVQRLSNDND